MRTQISLLLIRLKEWLILLPASFFLRSLLVLAIFFAIFIPIIAIWINDIDDSPELNLEPHLPQAATFETSHAVATAVALIDREINQHRWTSNDPWFLPGAWLDRMPAYQRGVMAALYRFGIEMSDQIGRTRGSSRVDPDLEEAAGLLKYPPDVWVWNFSTSLLPTASSETQYRAAMKALDRYNQRLSINEAVFERRADNLQQTLERIASDLGAASAALADRFDKNNRPLIDLDADETYYDIKGKMMTYYLILKALRHDFAPVIREKQLGSAWDQMMQSLYEASQLSNFFIFNNSPDSQLLPNHLTGMGFYLLRTRTQMKEISSILLK